MMNTQRGGEIPRESKKKNGADDLKTRPKKNRKKKKNRKQGRQTATGLDAEADMGFRVIECNWKRCHAVYIASLQYSGDDRGIHIAIIATLPQGDKRERERDENGRRRKEGKWTTDTKTKPYKKDLKKDNNPPPPNN